MHVHLRNFNKKHVQVEGENAGNNGVAKNQERSKWKKREPLKDLRGATGKKAKVDAFVDASVKVRRACNLAVSCVASLSPSCCRPC